MPSVTGAPTLQVAVRALAAAAAEIEHALPILGSHRSGELIGQASERILGTADTLAGHHVGSESVDLLVRSAKAARHLSCQLLGTPTTGRVFSPGVEEVQQWANNARAAGKLLT